MTDEAGIKKVLEYEKANGRGGLEMPHGTEGYDIKSYIYDGEKETFDRFIEVKSLRGSWGEAGVSLSKAQFKMAWKEGDKYWLYIVERANDASAQVYPIRNPARRATHYFFALLRRTRGIRACSAQALSGRAWDESPV